MRPLEANRRIRAAKPNPPTASLSSTFSHCITLKQHLHLLICEKNILVVSIIDIQNQAFYHKIPEHFKPSRAIMICSNDRYQPENPFQYRT
jgi:hypothetical protein